MKIDHTTLENSLRGEHVNYIITTGAPGYILSIAYFYTKLQQWKEIYDAEQI